MYFFLKSDNMIYFYDEKRERERELTGLHPDVDVFVRHPVAVSIAKTH